MKTKQITVTEFAALWGVTPRAVQKALKEGNTYPPIRYSRKIGSSYILDVSLEWYESKKSEL
jgi:hypothetical protein